jgi:hypothetical protein
VSALVDQGCVAEPLHLLPPLAQATLNLESAVAKDLQNTHASTGESTTRYARTMPAKQY